MKSYASNTRTVRNLETFHRHGWRILVSPQNPNPPAGLPFAIDNGAWPTFTQKLPFDSDGFSNLVETHGAAADFVVVPDIVAGGLRSLEFSLSWLDRLQGIRLLLLPVQDGMTAGDVGPVLRRYPGLGIFLGGSTEWKLQTMYGWGMVAHAIGCYYHVGRVNSRRRIRLAHEAGADSIDGTSGTRYSVNVPKLDDASRQPSLLRPSAVGNALSLGHASGDLRPGFDREV
jgi:hypothetical protein